MVHRAKKDFLLVLMLSAGILVPILLGLYQLVGLGGDLTLGWQLLLLGILVAGVVLLLCYPVNYDIRANVLVIRSGILKWEIPLTAIQEVTRKRPFMWAPAVAPSLDRLLIRYIGKGRPRSIMISPENADSFMRELGSAVDGLELSGKQLIRTAPLR